MLYALPVREVRTLSPKAESKGKGLPTTAVVTKTARLLAHSHIFFMQDVRSTTTQYLMYGIRYRYMILRASSILRQNEESKNSQISSFYKNPDSSHHIHVPGTILLYHPIIPWEGAGARGGGGGGSSLSPGEGA